MRSHLELALEATKDYLSSVDSEEFLTDFVSLQEEAEGSITVDQFFKTFELPEE